MSAATHGTLGKDSQRKTLVLLLMVAASVGLSACSAESATGPSTLGEPIGEVGDGLGDGLGGGIGGHPRPPGVCQLFIAEPCR